jgi:hypothetical protein
MTIQVPNEYVDKFSAFFATFEENLYALGIESYGITLSTLEDVFLKIGHSLDPIGAMTEKREMPGIQNVNQRYNSYEDQETHR